MLSLINLKENQESIIPLYFHLQSYYFHLVFNLRLGIILVIYFNFMYRVLLKSSDIITMINSAEIIT